MKKKWNNKTILHLNITFGDRYNDNKEWIWPMDPEFDSKRN